MLSLSSLADPTRRRIVELLAKEERTAGEIVNEFDISAPAISQHLKVLREASLVKVRVEGQHRVHSLNPAGLAELDGWLQRIKRTWAGEDRSSGKPGPAVSISKPPAAPAPEPVGASADSDWIIVKMENP